MPELGLKPDRYLAPSDLDALRTRAQDLGTARDWAGLDALRPALEKDSEFWPDLWGPLCAVAARRVGDPGATDLLAALVDTGFSQPELLDGELESAFADDPRWSALALQMANNVPPAPVELLDWPVVTPAAPLGLLDLPARADELRAQLPPPAGTAWETAVATLDWSTYRWRHANAHMEIDDAVACLQRVDEGQRFACVEYSLVLSQALNAVGIPARRLSLRQQDYHLGLGRGHVVSEAWIDDLARWVVFDGQNGLYWTGEGGAPLGAPQLQRAIQSGKRPGYVTVRDDFGDSEAAAWFSYFAHITSTAGTWSPGPFGLVFQRDRLAISGRLEHRPDALYPDLSEIAVQTALDGNRPALRLTAVHPYAKGFTAGDEPLAGDLLVLDLAPGVHQLQLAVRTMYGDLVGRPLRYRVADDAGR